MKLLGFLLENIDSVIAILLTVIFVIALIVKRQWDLLGEVLFGLVTWAEREYGTGTGALKFAAVVEKFYPHIPAILRVFLSSSKIETMIKSALESAKIAWEKNPKLITGGTK